MDSPRYIIKSRNVVTPDGMRPGAVTISSGRITDVSPDVRSSPDAAVEDFGDMIISPGLVDTHVHINEPGRTEWEGFECATCAAAAGGVTTLIEMPLNSSPVTTSAAAFREKCRSAGGKLYVDCGFYGGLVPGNIADLEDMLKPGVFGIKAFLIDSGIPDFPPVGESHLRKAMPLIAKSHLPLLVHCELAGNDISSQPAPGKSYEKYLASRPGSWECRAVELVTRLSAEYSCKVHIVHVSSSDVIPLLNGIRKKGNSLVTAETCPHYLCWSSEDIADGDTRFKCAPPIRDSGNREKLWNALNDGSLDFVVSDHSPAPPELKCTGTGDFGKSWGGIASLQFGLSIIWTEARQRGFRVEDVNRWMSEQPAKFAGLGKRKGRISPGYDADIIVWDPEAAFVVHPSINLHRHKLTPYEGATLYGKISTTLLGGKKVYNNGQVQGPPGGTVLYRDR